MVALFSLRPQCRCAKCKASRGEAIKPVLYGMIDLDNIDIVITASEDAFEKVMSIATAKGRKIIVAEINSPAGVATFSQHYFNLVQKFNAKQVPGESRPEATQ